MPILDLPQLLASSPFHISVAKSSQQLIESFIATDVPHKAVDGFCKMQAHTYCRKERRSLFLLLNRHPLTSGVWRCHRLRLSLASMLSVALGDA